VGIVPYKYFQVDTEVNHQLHVSKDKGQTGIKSQLLLKHLRIDDATLTRYQFSWSSGL
jgi:hypothetical protein